MGVLGEPHQFDMESGVDRVGTVFLSKATFWKIGLYEATRPPQV